MPPARRATSSSNNCSLLAFRASGGQAARDAGPAARAAATVHADALDAPCFSVIFRSGLLTEVGCVCAWPVLPPDGEATLVAWPAGLALAARCLGEPLRAAQLRAFRQRALPRGGGQLTLLGDGELLLDPHALRAHWHAWRASGTQAVDRQRFQKAFRRLPDSAKGDPARAPEVLVQFGVPVSSEALHEPTMERFCQAFGLHHAPGMHYGPGWEATRHRRRPAVLVAYDEGFCETPFGWHQFLGASPIPGPMLVFGGAGNPLMRYALAAEAILGNADVDAQAEDVEQLLAFLSADGRMFCAGW